MIEANKIYTITEFCKELKISKYTWDRRRDDLLAHLKDFYNYEYKYRLKGYGHQGVIIIKEVYDENYKPLTRVSSKPAKEQDYEEFTLATIPKEPLNSVANIARCAANDFVLDSKWELKPKSIQRYVRQVVNDPNKVIKEKEKVWVELVNYNHYRELTKEEIQRLAEIIKKHGDCVLGAFDAISLVEAGFQTDEEGKDQVYKNMTEAYRQAMSEFQTIYGFRPFRAAYLKVVE